MNASWRNTKPTNNPTTVPTWNGDAKLFDDYEFDVLMYKRGSKPGDHCFLVPRLISGLTGRAREHLRMAGDLDRFAVDGELEQFLEYLKTKMGIRRPQEEGMAFKKYIYEIKRARSESMTSWINRSDEALMDTRKKLATAPQCEFLRTNDDSSTNSRLVASPQGEIERSGHRWSHDHDRRQLEHQTC